MARTCRRKDTVMIHRLLEQSRKFDFFQAIRLLDRSLRRQDPHRRSVGKDGPPERETVRFRALPSLHFPSCDIADMKQPEVSQSAAATSGAAPLEMFVAFMGLTGPAGVLPDHYTSLLLERLRERDHALLDFLDLFNHRAISHFYRAWEKYRLPFALERCRVERTEDQGTQCVFSLIGFGTDHLRGRLDVPDDALLFYSGHFANERRSAASLEAVLSDYFEIPLRVQQFCGQWLYLDRDNRSLLASRQAPQGQNVQLGSVVVLGERIWDVQSKFRLYIGPLTYRQFRRFSPFGDALTPLIQLARTFVGPEYDFDVQLAVRGDQTPGVCLGATGEGQPRLGWNTWLPSRLTDDVVTDAVFRADALGVASNPTTLNPSLS